MTTSDNESNKVEITAKPKALPPYLIRLTFEERAALENAAAGMPLGAFVRERLFGEEGVVAEVSPREIHITNPCG